MLTKMQEKCSWDMGYHEKIKRKFHIRVVARLFAMMRNAHVRFEKYRSCPH